MSNSEDSGRQRLRYTELRHRINTLEEDLRELRKAIALLQFGLADVQAKTNKAFLIAVEAQRQLMEDGEGTT